MKKIILTFAMVACYMSLIHAQVHFGIKGGVSFENFKLKGNDYALSNSSGWHVGALLQFKVPVVGIGLQPELLYTAKKANVNSANVNSETNRIHYFEVPVNVLWKFNLVVVRPYLQAGPYFSYAVDSKGGLFHAHVNKFDWGVGLGAGVELWKLQLSGRYAWGMQNISKENNFKLRNNTFNVSLAFLF